MKKFELDFSMDDVIIIGYSGHAFVIADCVFSIGGTIKGYCDDNEKQNNPFGLQYLGNESESLLSDENWIIGIGDNKLRENIYNKYKSIGKSISVIHPNAIIGAMCNIGDSVLIAANATLNPLVYIGDGVIVNTGAIIEHECKVGDFSHIAPGAVLTGNVTIGKNTFVGANCVVRQGVRIGDNVTVGAGTVVLNDVPDNATIVGNPGKILKRNI